MNIFGSKSLDQILGNFTKAREELNDYVSRTDSERDVLYAQAREAEILAQEKSMQIDKANRVLKNINNLLADDDMDSIEKFAN